MFIRFLLSCIVISSLLFLSGCHSYVDPEYELLAKKNALNRPVYDKVHETHELTVLPKPILEMPPFYPAELKGTGTEGKVALSVVIDSRGNPRELEVIESSHPAFDAPAIEAVGRWHFKPGERSGTPVHARVRIDLVF